MTTFRLHVRVVPRAGLLDPQGQAVEHALSALGFRGSLQRPDREGHRAGGEGGQCDGRQGPRPRDVRQAARESGHRRLPGGGRGLMRRVAVVRFPGSNCDADTFRSAAIAGAEPYYVWHRETDLQGADAVMLPGGFSYGDYLRSGAIARFSPIMAAVQKLRREGGPVLGICNGFQILCEAGLLPGALMRNSRLSFVSRPVWLQG